MFNQKGVRRFPMLDGELRGKTRVTHPTTRSNTGILLKKAGGRFDSSVIATCSQTVEALLAPHHRLAADGYDSAADGYDSTADQTNI
jgi:hypothetical protein